jgi:protein-tyrosine phosphatase
LARAGVNVLVLCAQEYQPTHAAFPGVRVIHAPLTDDDRADYDRATLAAQAAYLEWRRGRTVLVTCLMGRNRSALVSVLLLHLITGIPTQQLIEHVRTHRTDIIGARALSNPDFVRFLLRVP